MKLSKVRLELVEGQLYLRMRRLDVYSGADRLGLIAGHVEPGPLVNRE